MRCLRAQRDRSARDVTAGELEEDEASEVSFVDGINGLVRSAEKGDVLGRPRRSRQRGARGVRGRLHEYWAELSAPAGDVMRFVMRTCVERNHRARDCVKRRSLSLRSSVTVTSRRFVMCRRSNVYRHTHRSMSACLDNDKT